MPDMKRAWVKNIVCYSGLLVLTVLFFSEVLFSSKTFIRRDNYIFHNPRRAFAAETIREGQLPLWNPYVACGVPFQANIQSSLFYPPSLIYYLLPFQQGFKYFIVLHYFLAALFMFMLMRQWKTSRPASLLSGIVFAFGGYMVSINDNVAFLTAGIWLPLVLLVHHRALLAGSIRYSILTGFFIAMQVFAGDASFYVLSSLICTGLYTVVWSLQSHKKGKGFYQKGWICLVLAWGFSGALAAVQLLPFAEFAVRSTRFSGLSFEMTTQWSWHPLELFQLLSPGFLGYLAPNTRWFGQMWLDSWYSGVFPLLLATLFVVYGKDVRKVYLVTLLFCSLFLALGKYNPVFPLLHSYLPGTGMLMYPVKFLFIACFAFSIIAGKGLMLFLEVCSGNKEHTRYSLLLGGFTLIVAGLLLGMCLFREQLHAGFVKQYPVTEYNESFYNTLFNSTYTGFYTTIGFCILFLMLFRVATRYHLTKSFVALCIIVLVYADLLFIGKLPDPYVEESLVGKRSKTADFILKDESLFRIYTHDGTAKRSFMHFYGIPFSGAYHQLMNILAANLNMYQHIYSVQEYAAIMRRNYYKILYPVDHYFKSGETDFARVDYSKKVFDMLNVKYLISPFPLPELGYVQVMEKPVRVYQNLSVLPRAFFVQTMQVVPNEKAVLERMQDAQFQPRQVAYVSYQEAEKIKQSINRISAEHENPPFKSKVLFSEYSPNSVTMDVETNRPGLLYFSDSYYPGWEARIAGTRVPIVRTNYFGRGVFVPAGSHRITFVFKPVSFRIGAIVSLTALLCACMVVFVCRKRLRREMKA